MDNNEKNQITRLIGNEAIKRNIDIKVKRHGLKNGGLIITHEGKNLKELMDVLISEELKIGDKTIERGEEGLLNRQHEISLRINNPLITDQEILRWVEKALKSTRATKWIVKKSGSPQENGREITTKVSGGTLKILKRAGMKLTIGGGLHVITIREKRE